MPNVAVLIDADNVSPAWIEDVLEEAGKLGVLALKRVYGDFSRHDKAWRELCARFAIHPIQQFLQKIHTTHFLRLSFFAFFSSALMVLRYSFSTLARVWALYFCSSALALPSACAWEILPALSNNLRPADPRMVSSSRT